MDPFKKYIQENREALDTDAPRPLVWERIEKELPVPAKKINIMRIVAWSAAACVVVLAGVGAWSILDRRPETKVINQSLVNKKESISSKVEGNRYIAKSRTKPDNPVLATTATKNSRPERSEGPKTSSPIPYNLSSITDLETNFTQVINLQKARISTTPMYAESAAYFDAFKVEMRQLEKDEAEIKKDISSKGMTNELLDQLINIYQQKLNILKQLQLEMNKTNNRYKQNRASVDTVRTYFLSI